MFKSKAQSPIPTQDYRIDMPGCTIVFNHTLKLAVIYDMDSAMPDSRYEGLNAHLEQQGWYVQVIVAAVGMPIVNSEDRE